MMPQCSGVTRDGGRCSASVRPGLEWCYNHHPDRAQERQRNASKAGKSKPNKELAALKVRVAVLAEDVLCGEADKGAAAVVAQLWNVLLRALALEIKVKEQEELEARIAQLEEAERLRAEARPWR